MDESTDKRKDEWVYVPGQGVVPRSVLESSEEGTQEKKDAVKDTPDQNSTEIVKKQTDEAVSRIPVNSSENHPEKSEGKSVEIDTEDMARKISDRVKKLLIRNLLNGTSIMKACDATKISRSTYYEWRKGDLVWAKEVDDARMQQREVVEDHLFENCRCGNIVAQIFYLCNRHPERWKNVAKIEYSGGDKKALDSALDELKVQINAIKKAK